MVDEKVETEARPHVRRSLSPEDLDRFAAEGAAMTLEEVIAYALGPDAD